MIVQSIRPFGTNQSISGKLVLLIYFYRQSGAELCPTNYFSSESICSTQYYWTINILLDAVCH
jgi:hypothetical protein